jgi:HEPN domain-containing protein
MNDTVKEWVVKAEQDYQTAYREAQVTNNPNNDAVCFHCQQCIEKLMKAVLIRDGAMPPKTHDLLLLWNSNSSYHSIISIDVADLRFLTLAAVDYRYPGETATDSDAREALSICTKLQLNLKSLLGIL